MNVSKPDQRSPTSVRAARAAVAVILAGTALATSASPLESQTVHHAAAASLYDTYHDVATGFVFVKLPTGWRFAGFDLEGRSNEVFHDSATGLVFVKSSDGWRFITPKD